MDGRRDAGKAARRAPARSRADGKTSRPDIMRAPAGGGRAASRRTPPTVPPTAQDMLLAALGELIGSDAAAQGRVVELLSRRALLVAARELLREHVDRCTKCGSNFVTHEPAFVHCHYCGRMHRVANASMLEQEMFELRLGLRLAS